MIVQKGKRNNMMKHIHTATTNNLIVVLCDTLAKAVITAIVIVLIINKNINAIGVCTMLAVPVSAALSILKCISLDMMFEENNKIYLKQRGTRKMREINIVECLHARKDDTLEWHINGVTHITEIPPMLVDYFRQNDN